MGAYRGRAGIGLCRGAQRLRPDAKTPARGRGLTGKPGEWQLSVDGGRRRGFRDDAHVHTLLDALLLEHDLAVHLREQRVVGARADVQARAHRRAALADDDVSSQDALATEALHAQSL